MRRVQVYRWQIPMDAGVVLRERRLKPVTAFRAPPGGRAGRVGRDSPFRALAETLDEAQAALMAGRTRREGEDPALPDVPSVAFGISCALAELDGSLPEAANYRAAPLCTGDPDELFALLSAMHGEKVAKIKVGLYEAVRDGMVVNLLLEAIPDLHLRTDANRAGHRSGRSSLRSTSTRRTAAASRFSKSRAKRATTLAPSPGKPASPSPGMRACAKPISRLPPSRASGPW